jgi:hypothetical protein
LLRAARKIYAKNFLIAQDGLVVSA